MSLYKRILLKISGSAMGSKDSDYNVESVNYIIQEIKKVHSLGVEIGIVIGGGNHFRGNLSEDWGFNRAESDKIGMLATIMNGIFIKEALKKESINKVRLMGSVALDGVMERFNREKAIDYLQEGNIVIFTGGIGQPYVTTDYPSIQRALEIDADVVMMAKNGVDGVLNGDPIKTEDLKVYRTLSYSDVIKEKLKVADLAAFVLAEEFKLPMHIFNFHCENSLLDICNGKSIGTMISKDCKKEFY
jgi:uridylate kinase